MRIGIASELLEEYRFAPDDPPDANRDLVSGEYLSAVQAGLQRLGFETVWLGDARSVLARADELVEAVDFVVNLAEGVRSPNRASAVPMLLEILGVPSLGSDAFVHALTLNKFQVGLVARDLGVATPQTWLVEEASGVDALPPLPFPVILKPVHEGSSIGVWEENIVSSNIDVAHAVTRLVAAYRQPVLVQEFISGFEATVPVVGNGKPTFCQPMMVTLDGSMLLEDKIYSSDVKHLEDERANHIPCRDAGLKEAVAGASWKMFRGLGIRDYARFDYRVSREGQPFLIDVNAIAHIGPESSFARAFAVDGSTYDEMLLTLLTEALKRNSIQW